MFEMGISIGMLSLSKLYLHVSMFILVIIMLLNYKYTYEVEYISMDSFSWSLMLLSVWIVGLSMMSSIKGENLMKSILLLLYMSFGMSSFMIFYIFFEMVMIPLYLMIMIYGSSPERLNSAMYMLFYTMFGSIPFLMAIVGMNSIEYYYMVNSFMTLQMFSITAFMVKLPMYGLHFWLPKAHVEAPVYGSMILAGVLLKLGGYGLLRVLALTFIPTSFFVSVGVWGGIMMCLSCMREVDLKKLVAFSSVHHMNLLMSGVVTKSSWGVSGCMLMMVAHGMFSSSMFYMVNIIYDRFNTRNLMMVKGLMTLNPSFTLLWFMVILGNSGGPPLMGFIAEVLLLMGILMWWFMYPLIVLFFLSVAYSMHLYLVVSHGMPMKQSFKPVLVQEFILISLHLIPSMIIILKLELLI